MREVYINVYEKMKEFLPETLKKDLQDHEQVCEVCGGLGVIKVDMPYGIKGDDKKSHRGLFPYKHQTLIPCPACFNGVQRICKLCGKPIQRGWIEKCNCEGYLKKEKEERKNKWNEIVKNAKEVDEKDITTMLFCEENHEYYDSVIDFIEDWECDGHDDEYLPERLWVSQAVDISFDADSILESACEDLHEDAYECCDHDELQKILDEYAAKQTRTKTYYPIYKEYVKIDWDAYYITFF